MGLVRGEVENGGRVAEDIFPGHPARVGEGFPICYRT